MTLIKPAESLAPNINQIYPIVNAVFEQMVTGADLEAVDTASLIAMGQRLEGLGKFDTWLNTLAKRIGYTIDDFRVYESQYRDLHRSQVEWGAFIQKIKAEMPEAVYDKTFDIGQMDGQSVDQWIINNPKVHQRFFDKETPYSFFITIQTILLKRAFLNEAAMLNLINMIFGEVQNKINYVMEELGRLCVNNFILNLVPTQHYHLVSMYNNNKNAANRVTTQNALETPDFLRYAVGIMDMVSDNMKEMSTLYNQGNFKRFTPKDKQRFYILSDFMSRAKTVVSYAAFNPGDVTANPDIKVSFWQQQTTLNDPDSLTKKMAIAGSVVDSTGAHVEKKLDNVLGIIFDYDAMGTFREEEEVLTTPVNARARYYNTFWHENQLWFNDMDENGIAFFLD